MPEQAQRSPLATSSMAAVREEFEITWSDAVDQLGEASRSRNRAPCNSSMDDCSAMITMIATTRT
jgi:hypothetical protein